MALRELPSIGSLGRLLLRPARASAPRIQQSQRRHASSAEAVPKQESTSSDELQDLESQSSFTTNSPLSDKIDQYDPVQTSKKRSGRLPPSRYQFKSPRYYRGPLHPHQPPPKSDPISREYVPGPFNHTRLEYTYQSTIAPDLMTLGYTHKPPGYVEPVKGDRLRTWDDSSPYHKGRPKRGPRGPGSELPVMEKDIDWQNIPMIQEVTVHTMVKGAITDSAYLHVAGILLQAITGVRPTIHKAKHSDSQLGLRAGKALSMTCTIKGDAAYEFVDKCINLVMPRVKDFPGIKGTTGDSSGNIAFGFDKEGTILFPEVSINYDSYPVKMIPGFHVVVKTTATSDRHARLLMSALGMPFYGKLID